MQRAIAGLKALAELTPSPTPTGPPASLVTPGTWGFAAIAFLGIAVALLLWDMLRRIRRARYRDQIREELDRQEREGEAAARAGTTDDEDVDPDEGDTP